MTAPVARRSWTASEHWGPTRGSSAPPSATRKDAPRSTDPTSAGTRRIMTEPSFNRGRASCRGPLPRVRPARFGASSDAWSRSSSVSPPSCDQPAVTTRLHREKIANTLARDARRCQPERSLGTYEPEESHATSAFPNKADADGRRRLRGAGYARHPGTIATVAVAANAAASPAASPVASTPPTYPTPIQHLVVIFQENCLVRPLLRDVSQRGEHERSDVHQASKTPTDANGPTADL